MWGTRLAWTGLALILAVTKLWTGESVNVEFVGAVILAIGVVLMWFGK